jgi:Tfp pilus assembly protein PilF
MKTLFITRAVILTLSLEATFLGQAFAEAPARQAAITAFQKTLSEFLATKDMGKAQQGFAEVSKLDPSYAQPYYNLAILAEANEDWATAQQDFTKYLELDPTSSIKDQIQGQIQNLKALAENDSDPLKKARRQYFNLIESAKALLNQKNYKAALEEARIAEDKDPQRWEAYAMSGMALFSMKRYRDAADGFRTAASKAPQEQQTKLKELGTKADNEAQYQDLCVTAAAQLSQGQYSAAAALLNSAWKLFPERTRTGFDAASNAILATDYNTARSILQELAKRPNEAAAADSMLTKVNLLIAQSSK